MFNWETKSELNADQLDSIQHIAQLVNQKNCPGVARDRADEDVAAVKEWLDFSLDEIESTNYYSDHFIKLRDYVELYSDITQAISRLQQTNSHLQHHFQHVSDRTSSIREECKILLQEQESLTSDFGRLDRVMWVFGQADRLANRLQFGLTLVEYDTNRQNEKPLINKEFSSLLDTVDRCLAHTSIYMDFSECRQYYTVFQRLQLKLCRVIKTHFQTTVDRCRDHVLAILTEEQASAKPLAPSPSDRKQPLADPPLSGASMRAFAEARSMAVSLGPLVTLLTGRCPLSLLLSLLFIAFIITLQNAGVLHRRTANCSRNARNFSSLSAVRCYQQSCLTISYWLAA
jgi:hypothetical protein